MADLIDRTDLRRELRDSGLYYSAVRQIVEAAPCVDDTATALIRAMGADLERLAKINESLRMANSELLKENLELKEKLAESKWGTVDVPHNQRADQNTLEDV